MLTSIDFSKLNSEIEGISGENEHNLKSERRTLEYVELAVNMKSLIQAGNGIEFNYYDLEGLNKLDGRYELLGRFL